MRSGRELFFWVDGVVLFAERTQEWEQVGKADKFPYRIDSV